MRGGGFDDHAIGGFGGAGGDGVADAFDLDDTESAAAEGVEAVIVAKSGDVFLETFGNLVNGFTGFEGRLSAIDGDGELRDNGGVWVVDHGEKFW